MVRKTFTFLCVIALAAAGLGYAATTGRVAGEVVDNQGVALPGVTVQITSAALIGGPQVAITDVEGRFSFNLLPPGDYSIEANLAGFKPATGSVRVQLDRVASITFNMVPEQFGGEIEVVAEVPVVDTTQVNTSQVFDQNYLQKAAIGSGGRDYLSIIGQAAGVVGTGNVNVYGSTVGENSYLIDGLNTTDPVTGTFGTNFNYDAIQEVNFQTGGFEAEFGQATGGIVNLVTKSGGNEFSGSFDVRYRNQDFTENGDHFDKSAQETQTQNLSGTLGGPIVRDRVWFFASAENIDNITQNEGESFKRNYKGWNYIGKITWQASDSNRVVLKYSGDPAEIPGVNHSIYVEESAKATQEQGGDIWQGELNSVLTESLLLNAQAGVTRSYIRVFPTDNSDNLSGHTNEDTNVDSNNYYRSDDDKRDRDEYKLNATLFADNLAGSHEFKAGVEYNDIKFISRTWTNGGGHVFDVSQPENSSYQYVDVNGDGYFNNYITIQEPEDATKDPINSTGELTTFYVQDAWRPFGNLTVKPGVRFDNVKATNHVGTQIADMDTWQPRLGFAWDLFGDAKHVVRASGGRFMDPTTLGIPSFASGVQSISHDYTTLEYICNRTSGLLCDPFGLPSAYGDPIFWTNWNGQEYVLFDNIGTAVSDPAQTLDQAGVGHLEAPYVDEYIVAYEAQLFPETSIELTYINKKTKNIVEDTCSGNTWVYGDGPRPSLDDPSTWTTSGDGCAFWLISNIPVFYRKYEGYVLKFETRQENFHILASWTNSDSTGTNISGPRHYAYGDADYFPVGFYNFDGYLPDHRKNRFKVNGYWLLPYDITIGFDGFWSSKGHITPTASCSTMSSAPTEAFDFYGVDRSLLDYCISGYDLFVEPRGSVTTKSIWQLDMQFSKAFRVGSVDLTAVVTVLNILDNEADASFNDTVFLQSESLGEPVQVAGEDQPRYYVPIGAVTSYWLPRRYELGFRVEF